MCKSIPSTDIRDHNIVQVFPHEIPFPKVTLKDNLKQTAIDLIRLLTSPPSTTMPNLKEGDKVHNALLKLATLLK